MTLNLANKHEWATGLDLPVGDFRYDMWDVFDRQVFDAGVGMSVVPIESIDCLKDYSREPAVQAGLKLDPRLTAFERMVAAANGRIQKRRPIEVSPSSDGRLLVLDGNATVQVLMLAGWKSVPVELVSNS
jgi:hypothetical protein